jgi:hypothetical protein
VGIKVNVSDQEAQSGERNFDALPVGKFHAAITAVELQEAQSDANAGQPMLNFEFTIQDTPGTWQKYANRKDWTNACLWDGALYTIVGILKALPSQDGNKNAYEDNMRPTGQTDGDGKPILELDIPTEPEYYEGQELFFRRGKNKKQVEKWPDMPERWVEVRGFGPYDAETAHKGAKVDDEPPF